MMNYYDEKLKIVSLTHLLSTPQFSVSIRQNL